MWHASSGGSPDAKGVSRRGRQANDQGASAGRGKTLLRALIDNNHWRGNVGHTSTKGIKMRASAYLDIAERTFGSRGSLALLRWMLAVVFLWFGGMKFTSYEAHGNAPLIDHSPIMSWLNVVFGVQVASYVIGSIELSTAVMPILGAFNAAASALGAAMSSVTFVITLSFFLTTPGVAEPTAGGFPAISAPIGQFLLKDLVLLAASVNLLLASIRRLLPSDIL
jgi:reactive chlorine resistance protein C